MDDNDSLDRPFLIVTGSSAGGIEALRSLIAGLPDDLNASVVIAQHLDPTHKSRLAEILGQHSPLPVKNVSEREELVPRAVYVVPSNRDVQIVDSEARAYIDPRSGVKPSIDRLFASAAEQYEDRVIAVILSGMGSDGLLGAQAVKERGGTVIIQDPDSASYPALPLAIPPTIVDFVAKPDAIGEIAGSLVRGLTPPSAPAAQDGLRALLVQLRDRSGIDFLQYKTPTIMRRLSRLMIASGTESVEDYLRYLQAHPEGYHKLIGAFLIKVTEFFRDAALFEGLNDDLLPRLIEAARTRGDELRVWSAGTSTGEEAYSVAILCAELMRESGARVQVRIFATDLDEDAIAFARRGLYSKEALRNVPASWIERYFVKRGDAYEVSKVIRNMTVFGQHDLAQRSPFPRIDLCLCRNVLIYFTKDLQTRALQLFAFSLRQGGILILGKAESTTPVQQYFRVVNPALKVYERTGERILIPPARLKDPAAMLPDRGASKSAREVLALAAVPLGEIRPSTNDVIGSFLFRSSIGVAVVDKRYDILSLNAAARNLLEIHGVGVGADLIHSVESLDREALRGLIDAALRGEPEDAHELFAGKTSAGSQRWLKISAFADHTASNRIDGVAIFIVDVTESVMTRKDLEKRYDDHETKLQDLTARVTELMTRQRSLLQANDELTLANGELRTINEQLLINSEESASANEEIETLNEEMQATNEELETLNEELQATVEELNTTNDELTARSSELERVNAERDRQLAHARHQHEALLSAMGIDADHLVVVQNGETLYASAGLEGSSFLNERSERWLGARELILADGSKVEVTNRSGPVDGQAVKIFLLRRREEG